MRIYRTSSVQSCAPAYNLKSLKPVSVDGGGVSSAVHESPPEFDLHILCSYTACERSVALLLKT